MLGNFFLKSDGEAWFKVHGEIHLAALPELVIENLSEGSFDYEVESYDVRDGTPTALMVPVTVGPYEKHKTVVPKIPAGASPAENPWCKITMTNATVIGLISKVTFHGPPGVIVEVPAVEQQ